MYKLVSKVLNIKKGIIRLLVLFSLCVSILSLVIPIAVQTIVNTLAFSSLKQPLFVLVISVTFILILAGFVRLCQLMVVENVQQTFFTEIALKFATLLPRLKLKELGAHRGPEIINRFFEVIPIQKTISILLIYLIELGIQAITSFILLAFYHPYLLILDGILVVCFIFALLYPYSKAMESALKESDYKHKLVAWLEEYLHCPTLIKFNENEFYVLKKVDENIKQYLKYRTCHFKHIVKHFLAFYGVYVLANSALLGIGGYLVLAQQLTLGQLVASEIVLNTLVYSFLRIAYHLRDIYALAASSQKINSVFELDYEPKIHIDEQQIVTLDGVNSEPPLIQFENISYVSKLGRMGLSGFSLEILPRDIICLAIKTQLGKNVLLDILLGFNYEYQGSIRVNGIILTEQDKLLLRKKTYLVQELEFFPGSLYENLTLNNTTLSKKTVTEHLKKLGVLKEIESLPRGINSSILSHRVDLTLSTLYKLSVIRAVLANPTLVILDEVIDRINQEDITILITYLKAIEDKPSIILTSRSQTLTHLFTKVVNV